MIDCHLITHPNDNPDWLVQCIASLAHPAVTVQRVDYVDGNINQARENGIRKGNQPYITWVDPDDWVEPGAFDALIAHIGEHGVCVNEYQVVGDDKREASVPSSLKINPVIDSTTFTAPHHLLVLRRDSVMEALAAGIDQRMVFNQALLRKLTERYCFPWLDRPLYNWRIHDAQWTRRFRDGME